MTTGTASPTLALGSPLQVTSNPPLGLLMCSRSQFNPVETTTVSSLSSSLSSRTATEFGLCPLTLVTLVRMACFTSSFVLWICHGRSLIKTRIRGRQHYQLIGHRQLLVAQPFQFRVVGQIKAERRDGDFTALSVPCSGSLKGTTVNLINRKSGGRRIDTLCAFVMGPVKCGLKLWMFLHAVTKQGRATESFIIRHPPGPTDTRKW